MCYRGVCSGASSSSPVGRPPARGALPPIVATIGVAPQNVGFSAARPAQSSLTSSRAAAEARKPASARRRRRCRRPARGGCAPASRRARSVAELLAREAEQPRAVAAALGVGRDGEEDDVAEQLLDRRVRRRVRPHVVERHQPEGERRLHPAAGVGEEEVRRRVRVEQRRDQPGGQVRERLLAELLELLERRARRRPPLARVVQRHLRGRGAAVRARARAQGGRAGAARAGPHKPLPHVTLPVGLVPAKRAPCSARRRP